MIKKDDKVMCCVCGDVVWIAVEDIAPKSLIESKSFKYPNGDPIPRRAPMICGCCGARFKTIDSEKKQTVR